MTLYIVYIKKFESHFCHSHSRDRLTRVPLSKIHLDSHVSRDHTSVLTVDQSEFAAKGNANVSDPYVISNLDMRSTVDYWED